jgi:hypothetical protein
MEIEFANKNKLYLFKRAVLIEVSGANPLKQQFVSRERSRLETA